LRALLKSWLRSALRLFSGACRATGWRRFQSRDGFTSRARFLAEVAATGDVLEIGPFDRPLVTGPRVRYFDIMDQQALRVRAGEHGRSPEGCPPVDYVSARGDLRVIADRRFDAVISAHCIEHQAGGRYYLIIPDKRFSFDHYLPETRASELLAARLEARTAHTPAAILAHRADTTHNVPWRHWLGLHRPERREAPKAARLRAALEQLQAADGGCVDVHGWFFTPSSFHSIIGTLIELGALRLRLERIYGTSFGSGEFFAVLRRP